MEKGGLLTKLTIYVTVGSVFSIVITLVVLYFVLNITGVPREDIPKILLYAGGVITLAFTLPIFFVRAFLYKLIIEKINKLADTMERVSKGDLDAPIDVKTNDEFGRMAEVFEKMRAEVKDMLSRLERKE